MKTQIENTGYFNSKFLVKDDSFKNYLKHLKEKKQNQNKNE